MSFFSRKKSSQPDDQFSAKKEPEEQAQVPLVEQFFAKAKPQEQKPVPEVEKFFAKVNPGKKVLEAEIVEVFSTPTVYVGKVVSCPDGYSYINCVRRGTESINTNGDVFCPMSLPVGEFVEFFELNPDHTRFGKFRTETATVAKDAIVRFDGRAESRIVVLEHLSKRKGYHRNAKHVDPKEVRKASENQPYAELLEFYAEHPENLEEGDIVAKAEKFLSETFANLEPIGVSFSIKGDIDPEDEQGKVNDAFKKYDMYGMGPQARMVTHEYESLVGMRNAFAFMYQHKMLNPNTVLPLRLLPDLFMEFPVWFSFSKGAMNPLSAWLGRGVKFFCDAVKSKAFSWIFQIYNYRWRPIHDFDGRDIIPPDYLDLIEEAKRAFDYVVIATPYHDLANANWEMGLWQRNVDPVLLGFKEGTDSIFFLARWSKTGSLFPNSCDMIADTIDHLRMHGHKLDSAAAKNIRWYDGNASSGSGENTIFALQNSNDGANGDNTVLVPFAQRVVKAFEQRRLFEFLRGEVTPEEIDSQNE